MLYNSFLQLWGRVIELALIQQQARDRFYSATTKNLIGFLKTGKISDAPNQWLSFVGVLPGFGEDVVIVMANQLADPDEVAEQFKQQFAKTFRG